MPGNYQQIILSFLVSAGRVNCCPQYDTIPLTTLCIRKYLATLKQVFKVPNPSLLLSLKKGKKKKEKFILSYRKRVELSLSQNNVKITYANF